MWMEVEVSCISSHEFSLFNNNNMYMYLVRSFLADTAKSGASPQAGGYCKKLYITIS